MDNEKLEEAERLLHKIVNDPRIIPGIHNYCDRWCERCTHTVHCSVYHMEQQLDTKSEETNDSENQKFWEQLSLMFKLTAKLVYDKMKEHGIDPDSVSNEEVKVELDPDPVNQKAVVLSREYTMNVGQWVKERSEVFLAKHEILMNIGGANAKAIADAMDVVQYYFMMVSTKTYRAFLPIDDDEEPTDALGSAKIAIILIDRSTAAWVRIMEMFPQFEDDILGFLKQLSVVKRLLLEHLPSAMEFKRPGFDE